ncbi:MAG: hypothetical protein IJ419_04620 [Agathobacter sp.]|nr:hypothetical protein [Agathobacter sp.]
MRIKIRIYNPYDLDIIALTEAKNFSVANAMKQTLKYYAAGKRYFVEIPALTETLDSERYVKGFYVELDDTEDIQAINFIKSIPDGMRNAFMKNIFRASFEVCPLSLYMGEGGAEYVAKMIANPRYGRHPVQREIVDHVYLAEGEIGASLSESAPDVTKLPQGKKAEKKAPATPKSKNASLRELTQNAYANASKKQEETKQKQTQAVERITKEDSVDKELEDLLDSMM